jgi:hypothetical protein
MNENAAIEFHDSVLERCDVDGGEVVVILTAYVHRSAGRPAVDAGTGWTQSARLRIAGGRASVSGPIDLVAGTIRCADHTYENIIPAPLVCEGVTSTELLGAGGERVQITGHGVRVDLVGEATYVETFPGVAV